MSLEQHIEFLKDFIDPESALLDKLLAKKILPKRTIDDIKSQATVHGKNEKLIEHIIKSKKKEELFLEILTEDSQKHIVNYLEVDGGNRGRFGDCWPLTEREIKILDANQESLVDRIDAVDSGLIYKLYDNKVINKRQKEIIKNESVTCKMNDKLLDILRRRSLTDYHTTIFCLKETKQEHIAFVLEHGGVTAELDIKLRHANNANAETVVRDLLKIVLQPPSVEDGRRSRADLHNISEDLFQESTGYIAYLIERLNLNDARIGESIILSFICSNTDELRMVKEEFTTKRIEDMFSKLYKALLEAEQVDVKVQWHKASYTQYRDYFQGEDDDDLSTEDDDELSPCGDDRSFTLSQTQLQRRISRIDSHLLCYYPSQEQVASLLIKRLRLIFSYYHKGRKLEDFNDFDFRIYTAGSNMLQEQTRRRLLDKGAACLPSNVYGDSRVLKYLAKKHVKTYRVTKETDKALEELAADAVQSPKKLFVIVADEAHLGASKGNRGHELINTWNHEQHPNVIVILVTATPGIFFRDNTFSRIPRISVAEKHNGGELVVVQLKDKLRNKEIIEVGTGKSVSKEIGPVKELHLFNWSECYEHRFEEGLVVTLRAPQRFSKKKEEQIWLSVDGLDENGLCSVVGKTNESDATPLLLQGRNNVVKITNLDKSKTLVVIPSKAKAKKYEIGFMPSKNVSGKNLSSLCLFKVLMNSGEDVLELEVCQENGPLSRLKYEYATSKLNLGPATTEASTLDSSMTYQFLIDSYKSREEMESDVQQYLSLNFYYNSIRNFAPEEQLIRLDKNFEEMVTQFKRTPADLLLAAEYAYYIVLLECMRKAISNRNSLKNFFSKPMEPWAEYLNHRKDKLDALKSALEDSEDSARPIDSSCFSNVVKFTEDKSWEKLHGVCKRLQRKRDLGQDNIDEFYQVLIGYLMHANLESFTSNIATVKKAVKRHTQALMKNTEVLRDVFNTKMSVLCRNETFRIVNDLIEEEENRQEQSCLNGHMKIIRASCTETANCIYSTLTLARKVASETSDCFFEIIRYFQRFKLSDHETIGPNSRIWQILQPKHCATYSKKSLGWCGCKSYDPKDNELDCKNCCHPHHSLNTFSDLNRLPCIVIVVEMGRMGDTFPPSLNVMDLRARRPNKPNLSTLIQEVGRICRYQVKSSYSDLPYVLVASKVMKTLEANLHKNVSFLKSAKLEADNEPNCHYNRLLLVGEPQIGKTGVFLNIAAQLRKLIKGQNDKFDFGELPIVQTTRKRSAGDSESHASAKRIKFGKSQSLTEQKVNTLTWHSEEKLVKSADVSKVKKTTSEKLHQFQDLLCCTICNETFIDPRNLPCLHAFCLKCIQRTCDDKPRVTCPMCEEEFLLADDGCEGLTENVFIKKIVYVSSVSNRQSCNLCENRPQQSNFEIPEATSFCEDCQEELCEGCRMFHERQNHELVPLQNYHLYRTPIESCKQHNKPIDMYCEDCETIVCAICLKDHNEHKKYSTVKTVVSEHREGLRRKAEAVNGAEECTKSYIVRIQKEIKRHRSCIEHLQKQCVELESLEADCERNLSTAKHCVTYCQELADKGTVQDVLREATDWQTKSDEIKQSLESMNDIQIPTVEDTVKAAIAVCSFLEQP